MNGIESVALPSGMKTSLSTNSSVYSTPCQSPGSLGSSLDSTNISVQSKDSLTTPTPSNNNRLLAIQQSTSRTDSRHSSRADSSSSGASFSSVKTLMPPLSTTSSPSAWRQDQIIVERSNKLITDPGHLESVINLKQDLTKRLFSLKQQVQSVVSQLNELEDTIGTKLDEICQTISGSHQEPKVTSKVDPEVVQENRQSSSKSFSYEFRKSLSALDELKKRRADQLIVKPAIQKLPAMVKGYLTRRMMMTAKVKDLIKTIKDTTILLDNYQSEEQVAKEEIDFHRRLMIQLEKSLAEFHDIFFNYSKTEQMKLIARSREIAIERVFRLSTDDRRIQEKPAKKTLLDKRKDSPLFATAGVKHRKQDSPLFTITGARHRKQDSPLVNGNATQAKQNSPLVNEKAKQVEQDSPLVNENAEQPKQEIDVEMKPIEETETEMVEQEINSTFVIAKDIKPKPKAAPKGRKGTKNSKKKLETGSASTPSPTINSTPALKTTSKPTEEVDDGPRRPKRAAATKRVTRAKK